MNNREKLYVFDDKQVCCASTVKLKLATRSSETQVDAVICSDVNGILAEWI